MSNSPKKGDNWSSILADLGVAPPPSESVTAEEVASPEPMAQDSVAVELSVQPQPGKPTEKPAKSSFFDIFPKIDLFGSAKKEKVDLAVGGPTESIVPAVQEAVKHARDPVQDVIDVVMPSRLEKAKSSPAPSATTNAPKPRLSDPWSTLASQLGILSAVRKDGAEDDPTAVEDAVAEQATMENHSETGPIPTDRIAAGGDSTRPRDRSLDRHCDSERETQADRGGRRSRWERHRDGRHVPRNDSQGDAGLQRDADMPCPTVSDPIPKYAFGPPTKRTQAQAAPVSQEDGPEMLETGSRNTRREPRPEEPREMQQENRRDERRREHRDDRREDQRMVRRDSKRRDRPSFFDEVERDSSRESQRKLEKVFGLDEVAPREETWDRHEPRRERFGEREEHFDDTHENDATGENGDFAVSEPERTERGGRRRRGRRGAEPLGRPASAEASSDGDAIEESESWNIENESKPVERQRGRRGKRGVAVSAGVRNGDAPDEEPFDGAELAQLHRGIPSWAEAVATVVEVNIGRRNQRSGGDRGGRRR